MKVNYTTKDGRITFEFEADNHVGVWSQLASLQEVFEEGTCQKCNGDDLRFSVRKSTYTDDKGKVKDCSYHELRCRKCGAKLSYGVLDDDTFRLFPKRKNRDGKVVGKWGWTKWNPETEQEE